MTLTYGERCTTGEEREALREKLAKQITNCLVATAILAELPDDKIVENLLVFATDKMVIHGPNHCGSAACFGGWVAVTPYFNAQNVIADVAGAPVLRNSRHYSVWAVSDQLFGTNSIFDAMVTDIDSDDYPGAERREIMRRLQAQFIILTYDLENL